MSSGNADLPNAPAAFVGAKPATDAGAVPRKGGARPAATEPGPYETSFCDEPCQISADAGGEQPELAQRRPG
jgi:hypothetical protein